MRKNFVFYIVALALGFSSCQKHETDYLFDKPIDERLTDALNGYQTTLAGAPGWKMFVYPKGLKSQGITVGGFCYYVKFTDANRVTMVSDFDTTMAKTSNESGFRLKAVQRPSIFFDTYSYIHVAADPDAYVSQTPSNQNGDGWGSDFNFAFTKATPGDTMILQGNQNFSDAVLVKVSAGEIDSALNKGILRKTMDAVINHAKSNNFLYLPLAGGKKASLSFDFDMRLMKFFYRNTANDLVSIESAFSFTTKSIWLKDPVSFEGYTFREIFWDQQNGYLYIMTGGNKVILSGDTAPVFSFPLTSSIGSKYSAIAVPTSPLYGQSSLFATKYATAKTNIKNGGYNLDLLDMNFVFDASSNRMVISYYVAQNGAVFLATTTYSYTVVGDVFKFTFVTDNQNAALIRASMAPLLDYIANDSFKLNAFATTSGFLGQFTSIETPAFYFSGALK